MKPKHLTAATLVGAWFGYLAPLVALAQPIITTQPQDQTNFVGTTVTLTVGASGAQPLAYQWQSYSSGAWSDLADATNTDLILSAVQTSNATDYRVIVTNVDGATISTPAHLYVIVPATLQFGATSYTVAETAGTVSLTILRLNDSNSAVTVDYSTTDGSATNGLKYMGTNGTLVFAAGETNKTIVVLVLNEGFVEGTKYFQVFLTNTTGSAVLGTPAKVNVLITDNDTGVQLEFANYWAQENEPFVLIGVLRGDDGNFPISVGFATANGTALAGQDYVSTNGTVTFLPGEKLKLLTVPLINDGVREPTKYFRVYLTNAVGQVLGTPNAVSVVLYDNDPGVQFVQNQVSVHEQEGSVLLVVTRGNDQLLDPFTVDYATTSGTAVAGIDYTETKGSLAFAAGEMTRSFTVPILDDGVAKQDRQFKVLLSNASGGMVLGTATNVMATVTVCDVREMLPHRIESLQVLPDGTVSLALGGGYTPGLGVVNRFQAYFDIYPLEVSTDLIGWAPLTWLVRTNAVTNRLVFLDTRAASKAQRFYRTPATTFPAPQRKPSGPYPVGVIDRTIQDDTRRNRYRISTNGSFPITIWYPAQSQPGQWPDLEWPEVVTRDPRASGSAAGTFMSRSPYFHSYSLRNAPFAAGLSNVPVVFWSHGWTDWRFDGLEWAEHLASQGYVVVAVDHFDSGAIAYPDGRFLFTDGSDLTGRSLDATLLQSRVGDLQVLLDEMTRWNQVDDLFAGRLDVQRVGTVGWSFGGVTAGEFCRLDDRCLAAVALDPGGYQAPLTSLGLQKPSLTMHNANYQDYTLFAKATTNAYWFQIQSTEHSSFSSLYWLVTSTTLARDREVARTITDWTLWFLNKFLKSAADPMPQPANYPQIFNFKQK